MTDCPICKNQMWHTGTSEVSIFGCGKCSYSISPTKYMAFDVKIEVLKEIGKHKYAELVEREKQEKEGKIKPLTIDHPYFAASLVKMKENIIKNLFDKLEWETYLRFGGYPNEDGEYELCMHISFPQHFYFHMLSERRKFKKEVIK